MAKDRDNSNNDSTTRANDVTRRSVLRTAGAVGGLTTVGSLSGCLLTNSSSGGDTIRVGDLLDQSGPFSIAGIPPDRVAQYAVDKINEDGGLLGREVERIAPDPQSDNQKYQNLSRRLIERDQVDVLMGAISGAAREAIRPIVGRNKQLYFHPSLYEGGLCDEYTYATGPTPTQQLKPLISYMVENFGSDCYIIAADYNFGRISTLWTEHYLQEEGGSVVGQEFIPLSLSEFGSTINRVQSNDPDWIMGFFTGSNHVSYFGQAESAGIDVPVGTTTAVIGGYEHIAVEPPALADTYVTSNYYQELPSDRNREFVQGVQEMFPDLTYINQIAESHYISYLLYAKAVEQAGTTDMEEVNAQLESGLSVEAPQGDVSVIPETHHLNHDMHLGRVTDEHDVETIRSIEDTQTDWLAERCSLASDSTWDNPTTEQYLPEE